MLLWEEYRAVHPGGYGYSRFCDLFRGFEKRLSPTMRQEHVAGDKVFVDYSGKKLSIVDPLTGEIREAEIFVAVLGASGFTYAEATWTQALPDWIGAHVRMFNFFGGVPRLIVPDNLKSGINHASFYDPEINRSYGMMASHYGVGVLPARPRRPKDKAKVENGVRFAQTCILGRMRRQTFFSLAEANAAIAGALDRINDHVMRRLGVSRRHLFETVERSRAGQPAGAGLRVRRMASGPRRHRLPCRVQELLLFRAARPHPPTGRHSRDKQDGRDLPSWRACRRSPAPLWRTALRHDPEHMPSSHRRYAEWTPERFRRWAASIGPQTEGLIIAILANRPHPEQGFRTCLGVLRLYRDLGRDRAEAVSARAVEIGGLTCKSIASILANRLAAKPTPDIEPAAVMKLSTARWSHALSPKLASPKTSSRARDVPGASNWTSLMREARLLNRRR